MRGPIATIQLTVAQAFGVTQEEILSHRKPKPLAQARIMAMAVARELTQASYPMIARQFGYRDHTTVLSACRRDKVLVERDAEYAAIRSAILAKLTP